MSGEVPRLTIRRF